jgi:hypothetical protein
VAGHDEGDAGADQGELDDERVEERSTPETSFHKICSPLGILTTESSFYDMSLPLGVNFDPWGKILLHEFTPRGEVWPLRPVFTTVAHRGESLGICKTEFHP